MRRALLFTLALAACHSALPVPTPGDASRVNVSLARLAEGRERYTGKCSSCHAPFAPSHLPASAWPGQVDEMAKQAHLEKVDRDLIVDYLRAFARPETERGLAGRPRSP